MITNMRTARAFSLIEVLVVIGIIGILAAILFPVFSRVKLAAKGTESLSNIQSLSSALLLYMHDYDETVVLSGSWNDSDNNDPFLLPDSSGSSCPSGGCAMATWPWLLNPYMKNPQATLDPLAPQLGNVLAVGNDTVNDLFFPQYGMNYVYLTPYDVNTDPSNPAQRPVSLSMITQPGATVFATSKFSYSESRLAQNGYLYFAESPIEHASPARWTTVEVPDCAAADSDRMHDCKESWGVDPNGFISSPSEEGITSVAAGANTGGVAFRNTGDMATVVFMNGSAKKMSPGALAAGTNWTPTIAPNMVTTTSPSLYLWDLQ